MAVAFPRPSPLDRDPDRDCPGWWLSMDRSLTSPAGVNCRVKAMLTVRGSFRDPIRDSRRRRDGTWSLGKGNHPTVTRQANCVN